MQTPDIYKNLNIKTVINGKSWFTNLGGSLMKPEVLDAISDLNEVVIRATKGTTQITRIIASIM